MKKVGAKVVAMLVALAMIFSVVPGMAATVEAGNESWEEEIIWLDAEIKVINGQPMMVIEGDEEYGEEYFFIPLELPEVALFTVDGQEKGLEVKDNSVLVQTEDGIVAVPLEDFCVVIVSGEVMLIAEVNPILESIIFYGLVGAAAGGTIASALKVSKPIVIRWLGLGAVAGGIYGASK